MTDITCKACKKFKEDMWCAECHYEPRISADVVNPVHCKDCVYSVLNTDLNRYCAHFDHFVDEEDYCSYGERAEE